MRSQRRRIWVAKLAENKNIPSELWMEVFVRLPVKTLLRFRCVCKTWCSIIDNPDLISMHMRLYKNNCDKTHFLVMETEGRSGLGKLNRIITIRNIKTYRKTAQILRTDKYFKLVGNCNGLVLLDLGVSDSNDRLRLWNRSIRKSLIVPPSPLYNGYSDLCGLGFSPFSNDYKVVVFDAGDLGQSFAVYSLRNNIWTTKHSKVFSNRTQMLRAPFYSGQGALYWRLSDTHVLSFDFDTEELHKVELPDSGSEMSKTLFVLGDSLAVYGISSLNSCIWVMNKDGAEKLWSLRFSGDSSLAAYSFFKRHSRFTKVFYDDKRDKFYVVTSGERPMSYNITTQHVQHLGYNIQQCTSDLDAYVENLELCREREGQTLVPFP